MKNNIKSAVLAILVALAFTACAPQEMDDYSLGDVGSVTVDQVAFTQTVSTTSDNIITFTNTTKLDHPSSIVWNLGNGVVSKAQSITTAYPLAGTYTVSLSVSTADGTTATKSQVIVIAKDDASLLDTPNYRNLTGGPGNANGKTWVFDQYNLYSAQVATATGKDIRGHMGLGAAGSYSQGYWGAGPNEKANWKMYDFKFTFMQNGLQLNIQNAGLGYGRNACMSEGGFSPTSVVGDDATFNYGGGKYTFSMNEAGAYPKLALSGNAFMGYYCGTQEYEIIYLTEEAMALRVLNTKESQDWIFIYVREDLNKPKPSIVKTLKEVPLFEDFEGDAKVSFESEDMGAKTAASYNNPAPVPLNESAKVFLYQKSTAFYSNISFTTKDYLFDLSKQNKIRMKVYIPGYNDYVKDGEVAGDWLTQKKLLQKVAVKLQDSSKGGNAWETETVVSFDKLQKDKWLELEFDFSKVAQKKDYDKIVIQFGDEGHSRPGIFFFDDFSFDK